VTRLVLCRHPHAGDGAEQLAAAVLAYEPSVVYSSDLDRAHVAAKAIAPDAIADPRLREIDRGEAEGLAFDELPAVLQRGLLDEPTRVRFPGGETYAELRARVVAALDEIAARHAGETVAVVTHAGALRAALAAWLGLPDEAVFRIDQDYGALNVVDLVDGVPFIRLVNGLA
jgi:broad specificity phosphatase PhoE